MPSVTVAVTPPYDVVIAPGALGDLAALVAGRRMVVVVTQSGVAERHGGAAIESIRASASLVESVEMGDGEAAKSFATVEALCSAFARHGVARNDLVVALGGGVVGDTAGFAASIYHRGVAVVQAPTTLLAQVDAAIGGKTAVNLAEGKNLVGAFHQPIGVVADTATLATLSEREFRCGLGEVAKYALMPQGAAVAELLAGVPDDGLRANDAELLTALVAACVEIKAAVVAADPEERTGIRATLNYGHTFAHAIETTSAHALAHGEAVAVGLVFAATLARSLDRIDDGALEQVLTLLTRLGLPTVVPFGAAADGGLDAATLLAVMRRDKKAQRGLTFVLPGPDGLQSVEDPPVDALEQALRAVGVAVG